MKLYRREWLAFSEYCKAMGYGAPAHVCEKAVQSYLLGGEVVSERASPEEFTKRSKEYWVLFCRLYVLLGISILVALLASLSIHLKSAGTHWLPSASTLLIVLSATVAGVAYFMAEMLHSNRTGGNSKSIVGVFRQLEAAWLWAWSLLLMSVAFSLLGAILSAL